MKIKNNLLQFLCVFFIFFIAQILSLEMSVFIIDVLFCIFSICSISLYIPSINLIIAIGVASFFLSIYFLWNSKSSI